MSNSLPAMLATWTGESVKDPYYKRSWRRSLLRANSDEDGEYAVDPQEDPHRARLRGSQ